MNTDNNYQEHKEEDKINTRTGLPNLTDDEKEKESRFFFWYSWWQPSLLVLIGTGIAFAIHNNGDTAKYEERLELTR